MGKPLKRAKTVTELIQQLRCRGMEIDGPLAVQWLSNVSYYRLSAYWYPARQLGPDSHRSDAFVPGDSLC